MGAESRGLTFERCASSKDLFVKWREAQREDQYERGHGSYRSSIGDADLTISPKTFATLAQARNYADSDEANISKRDAVAFRYGDATKAYPLSAKDKALEASYLTLKTEIDTFEHNVLKRFVASKSASKKCVHCDSVISKKSREWLAKQNYLQRCDELTGFDKRDYVKEQTECPACNKDLLLTETDLKRRKALTEKFGEVHKKREAASKLFNEKVPPYGYFVLAVVPC